MQAPSYTFLMGEYVSLLKILVASPKLDASTKQFYQTRLQELKGITLDDLPLYLAEVRCIDKKTKELIQLSLYGNGVLSSPSAG